MGWLNEHAWLPLLVVAFFLCLVAYKLGYRAGEGSGYRNGYSAGYLKSRYDILRDCEDTRMAFDEEDD